MGLLTNIFKSKPKNEINKLERIIARETTQRMTLKELGGLAFNPENHLNFIIAELSFYLETNSEKIELKEKYIEFINQRAKTESFIKLKQSFTDYYNGEPNLNKALWNITSNYLNFVWTAPQSLLENPIALTIYSQHISHTRDSLRWHIESDLINKIKK